MAQAWKCPARYIFSPVLKISAKTSVNFTEFHIMVTSKKTVWWGGGVRGGTDYAASIELIELELQLKTNKNNKPQVKLLHHFFSPPVKFYTNILSKKRNSSKESFQSPLLAWQSRSRWVVNFLPQLYIFLFCTGRRHYYRKTTKNTLMSHMVAQRVPSVPWRLAVIDFDALSTYSFAV